MKILVVTSSFPRFRGDIAGRFIFEWAGHLRALGHELCVMTWADSSVAPGAPQEDADFRVRRVRYAPAGYDTLFFGAGTPENIRQNPWRAGLAAPAMAAMAAAIGAQIARERPDIVVGHWLVPAGILARVSAHFSGIPSLIIGHSGGVHLLEQLSRRAIGRPVARRLATLCASAPLTVPSAALAQKFAELPAQAAHLPVVLPMGFEPATQVFGEDALPGQAGASDWLCMGRLVEIKGVELAIRAFCAADFERPTTLHIAGDGPQRASLEALASALGALSPQARVVFHGTVTGQAKAQLLARCGFALFCSKTLENGRHEGLPISFLEAAGRGVIALCAAIPGLEDYVAMPAQQCLQTRDVARWSQAIGRLARLEPAAQRQLGQAQQARVDALTWPNLILKWDRLLREIAGKN